MSGLIIGYARVSTEEQDLTAQRDGLTELGVEVQRIKSIMTWPAPTATDPACWRLSPCRAGDTLVVTKLAVMRCPRKRTA